MRRPFSPLVHSFLGEASPVSRVVKDPGELSDPVEPQPPEALLTGTPGTRYHSYLPAPIWWLDLYVYRVFHGVIS